MSREIIFGVYGGDVRTDWIKTVLAEKGYETETEIKNRTPRDEVKKCSAVFLPAPLPADGKNLYAPSCEQKLELKSFIKKIPASAPLFCGRAKEEYLEEIRKDGYNIYDCFKDESFLIENAVITAEGAVQLALNHTKDTLWNSKTLVLGYGRVAKALTKRLSVLCGKKVKVYARREQIRTEIRCDGLSEIDSFTRDFDNFNIVFNTVPSLLIDENLLKKANKNCLIIDLASSPGGVDFQAAEREGITAISALSLPAKTAPKAAAEIFVNTALKKLTEVKENAKS